MQAAGHPFLSIPSSISYHGAEWGESTPSATLKFNPLLPQAVPWLPLGLRMCILVICSALTRVNLRRGPQGPSSRLRAVSAWTSEVLGAKGTDFWGSSARACSRAPEAQGMEGFTLWSPGLLASEALYRAWGPSNPGVKVILVFRATTLVVSSLFPVNHTTGSV